VTGWISFEFATEEERDEFLDLNDLCLGAANGAARVVLDRQGHHVGRLAPDNGCRAEIREWYCQGVRATSWWRSDEFRCFIPERPAGARGPEFGPGAGPSAETERGTLDPPWRLVARLRGSLGG